VSGGALNNLDLDLVPPVLIRTLGDELSPSGTVVGSISRFIRINTQCVQILLQCVLPCPLWSSSPPPATFWSPHYGQTSWSGCRESQDVPNKSSSSGSYCVMQCSLSSSCHHFVICDVVAPWNAQNTPKASTVENINHHVDFVGCFPINKLLFISNDLIQLIAYLCVHAICLLGCVEFLRFSSDLVRFSNIMVFRTRQHICLAWYILLPIHLANVHPSVHHTGGSYKTVEERIMKFSLYGSPILLVFEG